MAKSKFSVKAHFDRHVWGLGFFGNFVSLGIAAVVIGPLHLHVTWPVR